MDGQKRKTWIPAKSREDDRRGSREGGTESSFCQRMPEPLQSSTALAGVRPASDADPTESRHEMAFSFTEVAAEDSHAAVIPSPHCGRGLE